MVNYIQKVIIEKKKKKKNNIIKYIYLFIYINKKIKKI